MTDNSLDDCRAPGSTRIIEPGRRNPVGRATVDPPTASDLTTAPHHFKGQHELCPVVIDRQLRNVGEADRISLPNLEICTPQPGNELVVRQEFLHCNFAGDVPQGGY
jgi:hypothetical protein